MAVRGGNRIEDGGVPVAPVNGACGSGRAFTLLEMLLAVAILVSVAGLGSVLWMQSTESAAAAVQRERGLHLQRVGTMLRDQWSARRAMVLPGEELPIGSGGVVFRADGFSFVSAMGVLEPSAALVRAEYRVVRRQDGLFDLHYEEVPLRRFGASELDRETVPMKLLLLEGCEAIVLSRYGLGADDAEVETGEVSGERRPGWHRFAAIDGEESKERTDALRLDVRFGGEEALWVLVARPSR